MENDSSSVVAPARPLRDDRMIFLLPPSGTHDGRILDIREIWRVLWRSKYLIIAVTVAFTLVSIAYALLATQWFKAEIVLVPAGRDHGLAAQLGGRADLASLASLAGVDLSDRGDNAEALAVLRSRDFARSFIEERNLLPVLFADKWDAAAKRWKGGDPKKWPDERDGVRYFNRAICRVVEDKKLGLVILSIEWKDRGMAAEWANALVARANERMRQRTLAESQENVKFLRDELSATNVVSLQQSISRLLENELQTLMLARGNKEFAFRVVDRANVPKWRSWPKRTLIVALATIGGGIFSVLLVLVLSALRENREPAADASPRL